MYYVFFMFQVDRPKGSIDEGKGKLWMLHPDYKPDTSAEACLKRRKKQFRDPNKKSLPEKCGKSKGRGRKSKGKDSDKSKDNNDKQVQW